MHITNRTLQICSLGLQEVNRNLAADTKVTVVLELLDVLDDLERGARLEPDTGSTGSSTLGTLAQKFTSRLASKDFQSFRSPSEVLQSADWNDFPVGSFHAF